MQVARSYRGISAAARGVAELKSRSLPSVCNGMFRIGAMRWESTTGAAPPASTATTAPNKGKKEKGDQKENKYSHTLNLPETQFNQRANSQSKEPELQKWWNDNKIYETLAATNTGPIFTIHDGPPYANGDLHIGHALNKILKDIINRYEMLRGKRVTFVPGWDCHGLPIEMKVLQTMKSAEKNALTPIQTRKKAAEFATATIANQMASFQRYGVWASWDERYSTIQPEYEAAQIRAFAEMFHKGYIYRGRKPVHWSPSSRTALAEAELEYPPNHISKSIYVAFPVKEMSPELLEYINSSNAPKGSVATGSSSIPRVHLSVWTTTPWTIPANQAVAVHTDIEYCLVTHPDIMNGEMILVAKDLIASLGAMVGLDGSSIDSSFHAIHADGATIKGVGLVGCTYSHPLTSSACPVLIGGDYINTESGTALVHTAPGHGQEDFAVGKKHNLTILSPVDDGGRFTSDVGVEELIGLSVLGEGNEAVIRLLSDRGLLLKQHDYHHKYPYDWRTKKPTIFRATEQWFADVSSFRPESMAAISTVNWVPQSGYNRITKMIDSRGDWCISRQRAWGVPIPVFYHKLTGEPLLNRETIEHIATVFATNGGSDAWWTLPIADLLPAGELRARADEYRQGFDTMDVWFDSGTSWSGVLERPSLKDKLSYPADMYLEGSDQHRGWFQSSLLTSVATRGKSPYRTVLTHGFVLDEKGEKMSKSLKNVVDPLSIIDGIPSKGKAYPAYGADTLRLWVASVDYTTDVSIGNNIIRHVSDTCRKLRNTMRYLLSNLSDFDPVTDAVPVKDLSSFDHFILGRLSEVMTTSEKAYDAFHFSQVYVAVNQFVVRDLSNLYLDASKDRLYISAPDSYRRRSCQTVLHLILEQLLSVMAPILPHLTEDVWQHLPYDTHDKKSVFFNGWSPKKAIFEQSRELGGDTSWSQFGEIRNHLNSCFELARRGKVIGASQEAEAFIYTSDEQLRTALRACNDMDTAESDSVNDLRHIFIVSKVHILDSETEITDNCGEYHLTAPPSSDASSSRTVIGVRRAAGKRCERCWYICPDVGQGSYQLGGEMGIVNDICQRCATEMKCTHHA